MNDLRHRPRRLPARPLALIAAVAAAWGGASVARAALIFQSEFPTYAVNAAGTQTASVKLYVAQTGATTVLTDEGGLNSVGFIITPAAGSVNPPTLQSIAANAAFTGAVVTSVPDRTLYSEITNTNVGVPADGGRVFVGTFTYTGSAGVAPSTTFQIADKSGDSTYTAAGTLLDAQLQPGTFTVTVPEPTTLAALAGVALLALRRRRA